MDLCEHSISGKLLQALGEFNRGDWFECHETLEDLWIGSEGEIGIFTRGRCNWPLPSTTGATAILAGQ